MKSMIVVLAIVGGIGLGVATHAMAADTTNLSCITEINNAGATVRDCNRDREPIVYAQALKSEESPDSTPPLAIHEGGPDHEGHRRGGERGEPHGR